MRSKIALLISVVLIHNVCFAQEIAWEKIGAGLFFSKIDAPIKSQMGDSKITILKINPENNSFVLLSARETDTQNKTAESWAKDHDLVAVINAGMYQEDYKTNVGYMRNYDFENNKNINSYNAFLAFNTTSEDVPSIRIIDRKCDDWENEMKMYNSVSQGIRMIDCNQKNCWSQQNKKWSIACIGIDKDGNVLFIHARSPYSVHDFIAMLLELPLDLYNAIYLEGGPEASLYLENEKISVEEMGSYETGFFENNLNTSFWEIPNIIGVREK